MSACIHWIGDSTVQCNRIDTWPQCGMGQVLYLYLRPEVAVYNHAKNGRSTKSFLDEGRFAPVEAALDAGDVLLISFGHNDEKTQDPARFTTPEQYAQNLRRYAARARAKGALPVVLTSLTRRRFAGDVLMESHGAYPAAARALAAAEELPLIDLTAASRAAVQRLGPAGSQPLYMNFAPGLYPNYPAGREDNTHLRHAGAVLFAGLVADGLRALGAPYADLLLPPATPDNAGD